MHCIRINRLYKVASSLVVFVYNHTVLFRVNIPCKGAVCTINVKPRTNISANLILPFRVVVCCLSLLGLHAICHLSLDFEF